MFFFLKSIENLNKIFMHSNNIILTCEILLLETINLYIYVSHYCNVNQILKPSRREDEL